MIAAIEILVLCTGNICRSPMAAGLLRDRIAERGLDAHVHSAGLLYDGRPASQSAVDVLAGRGIDISDHASAVMTRDDVQHADLVLAMARRHLRESVVLDPSSFVRTYTLKELVRRGCAVGGRMPGESIDDWLTQVHEGRSARDHLGDSLDDDVADPIGEPLRMYERTAKELEALTDTLVDLLWGQAAIEEHA